MLDFVLDLVAFLLKTVIIVGLCSIPVILAIVAVKDGKKGEVDNSEGSLKIVDLKKQAKERREQMEKFLKKSDPDKKLHDKEIKVGLAKEDKKAKKEEKDKKAQSAKVQAKLDERKAFVSSLQERNANGDFCPRNLYVVDFKGSTNGREFKTLRRTISSILDVANTEDEVVINLTSPGGLVNSYGLCASQLQRIRDRNIHLTVTVDEVAASGGYLMACVANHIVAAPFAYIGSIGVIAGIPNFRKVLNKFEVDYEQITAGKYKRTLSMLGENTEEGRKKFKEELEAVHQRFKEQVLRYRPQLDMEKVATGEHWLASDALELHLVDELATSDEYIARRIKETRNCALKLSWEKKEKKNLLKKYLPLAALKMFHKGPQDVVDKVDEQANSSFLRMK